MNSFALDLSRTQHLYLSTDKTTSYKILLEHWPYSYAILDKELVAKIRRTPIVNNPGWYTQSPVKTVTTTKHLIYKANLMFDNDLVKTIFMYNALESMYKNIHKIKMPKIRLYIPILPFHNDQMIESFFEMLVKSTGVKHVYTDQYKFYMPSKSTNITVVEGIAEKAIPHKNGCIIHKLAEEDRWISVIDPMDRM